MYKVETGETTQFEFSIGRKKYAIPSRESLPMPKFRAMRKRIAEADEKEEEAINAVFDLFDEYAPGALDSLTFEQALKLCNAYATGGDGDTLGESSTSSD